MRQFIKAVYAAVVALLGSLVTVLVDGTSFGDIGAGAWVSAVLVALIAGGGVYGLRNVPPEPKP